MVLSVPPTNRIARITFASFVLPVIVRYSKGLPAVVSLTALVEGYTPHLRARIKLFKMVLTKSRTSPTHISDKPTGAYELLPSFSIFRYKSMRYAMGNVLGSEKAKSSKHTSTVVPSPQTPPRTPTLSATAAQTLAEEIRDIHHALSKLPDLRPAENINSLLTRLVSVCVVPYSTDFVDYFFNIEGISALCEKLRPLCAAAEGELERFWASRIIQDSTKLQGKSITTAPPSAT